MDDEIQSERFWTEDMVDGVREGEEDITDEDSQHGASRLVNNTATLGVVLTACQATLVAPYRYHHGQVTG